MTNEDRLREVEKDVRRLMDYLGLITITFEDSRTGDARNPYTYMKRIIRIKDLNKI